MKDEEKPLSFFEGCKNAFIMVIMFWLFMFLICSEFLLK